MNTNDRLKNKKGLTFSQVKSVMSIVIIIAIITPNISVQAEITKDQDHPESYWKHYPYQPPGTDIVFPTDEGSHDTTQFPIEWWYVNFHLTGQTTGNEYGSYVAFYKIQSPVAEKKEIRIFSISVIASEKTFNNVQIGTLTASTDHLDLGFKYITDNSNTNNQALSKNTTSNLISQKQVTISITDTKTAAKCAEQTISPNTVAINTMQKTNPINTYMSNRQEDSDGLIQNDCWYTKNNDQDLIPFQYFLEVSGNSQQDNQLMKLIVDMDCQKQPLIVGGDGLINYENDDFSYYYSLTSLIVTGSISVHGFTEYVSGTAWIDHQWGNFINQNPPPLGLTITYEWFSMKLNDNREITVGDMWDRGTGDKIDQSLTDGLNICNSDGTSEVLNDYTITPLAFWNDSTDEHFYSCQWCVTEKTKSINLIVTPVYFNQMMRFKENYPILQQVLEELFPSGCFWEGVCIVTGTINGTPVNGKSYVELTHDYYNAKR